VKGGRSSRNFVNSTETRYGAAAPEYPIFPISIDVESERPNAFDKDNERLLQDCASSFGHCLPDPENSHKRTQRAER
jgi:hypothetical protein